MNLTTILIGCAFLVGGISGGVGTGWAVKKFSKPIPPCPECNCICPPATQVELQDLDFDQLRKVKGDLHVTQSLNNVTVIIQAKDSAMWNKFLKSAEKIKTGKK